MIIKVWYSDESVGEYHSIEEAQADILENLTGCDFAISVDNVAEVDEHDRILKTYGCQWGVKLINI